MKQLAKIVAPLLLVSACSDVASLESEPEPRITSEETAAAQETNGAEPLEVLIDPLFPNSIVSNEISFLELGDMSMDYCVGAATRETKEMPGDLDDELFQDDVGVFAINYEDGTTAEVWASARFTDDSLVETEVEEIAKRLALQPTFMRETLSHVVLHPGDAGAYSEHLGHFMVVYQENMALRRTENDMEETLFHESVHATMDETYRDGDPEWELARAADPGVVTDYALEIPTEDLAESAIFAFTDKYHPGRLSEDLTVDIYELMPARIEYIQGIFPDKGDFFEKLRPALPCA